ncbi:MAG: SPOR domain-containing protein [Candidatus Cryptobacteroides sp.]
MRKTSIVSIFKLIVVLLPLLTAVTGCDFFRKLAGRPTSVEIAVMEEELRIRQEAADKAARDSAEAAQALARYVADSTAAAEYLKGEKFFGPDRFGGIPSASGLPKYQIILGAFSKPANAERFTARLRELGYGAVGIPFGNGFTGVGICGTADIVSLADSLREVKGKDFCPEGVWILENRQ